MIDRLLVGWDHVTGIQEAIFWPDRIIQAVEIKLSDCKHHLTHAPFTPSLVCITELETFARTSPDWQPGGTTYRRTQLTNRCGSQFTDAIASLHPLTDTSFNSPVDTAWLLRDAITSLHPLTDTSFNSSVDTAWLRETQSPALIHGQTQAQLTSRCKSPLSDSRGTKGRRAGETQPFTDDRGTSPAGKQYS